MSLVLETYIYNRPTIILIREYIHLPRNSSNTVSFNKEIFSKDIMMDQLQKPEICTGGFTQKELW